jgi:hypothetical protein
MSSGDAHELNISGCVTALPLNEHPYRKEENHLQSQADSIHQNTTFTTSLFISSGGNNSGFM